MIADELTAWCFAAVFLVTILNAMRLDVVVFNTDVLD